MVGSLVDPYYQRKSGGVSIPYLHVKKDGKTWYMPMIKSNSPEIMSRLKFIYKGKEYFPLSCKHMNDIGVITLVNGEIHQSINFRPGVTIFFNKAKRLALYGGHIEMTIGGVYRARYKKLMDVNYDDVIRILCGEDEVNIVNLTTGEIVSGNSSYKYLEFREE